MTSRLAIWAALGRGGLLSRTSTATRKSRNSRTSGAAAHPKVRHFWNEIDQAAVRAVRDRGAIVRCGPVTLNFSGAFLWIRLPSGRDLAYPYPRIINDDRGAHRVLFGDNAEGQFKDCRNGHGAYGGVWTENIVSGIARDLLVAAMFRVEAAGYPIVLHVHDELVCEVPIGFGSDGGIHRSDDAQAGLGRGAADRGQCLARAAIRASEGDADERCQTSRASDRPDNACRRPVGAADRARAMVRMAVDAGNGRQMAAMSRHGNGAGSCRQR